MRPPFIAYRTNGNPGLCNTSNTGYNVWVMVCRAGKASYPMYCARTTRSLSANSELHDRVLRIRGWLPYGCPPAAVALYDDIVSYATNIAQHFIAEMDL